MKKIISCFVFLLGITVISFAQNHNHAQSEPKTAEERADMHTKKLTQELTLSADQATQVKAALVKFHQNEDAIRQKHVSDTDKSAMRDELKAAKDQSDADLKTILTADQYTKYESAKSQGHGDENHGEHKGGGNGGNAGKGGKGGQNGHHGSNH